MPSAPDAYVTHSLHRRARIRIPARRQSTDYFGELKKKLEAHQAVRRVDVNPVTGSVLIHFDGSLGEILSWAKTHFRVRKPERKKPVRNSMWEGFKAFDEGIKKNTQGQWDLRALASTGLFALSALQVVRGAWMPPAWTLFRDAVQILEKHITLDQELEWQDVDFG